MYCLYIHLYTFRKSFEDRPLNKWLSLAGAGSGIHVFAAALFGFICRSGIQAPACVCLRRHCLGSSVALGYRLRHACVCGGTVWVHLSLWNTGSGIHVFAAALFGFICRSGIQAPACVCLRRHCLGSTDVSSHSNCSNNSYSRDNFLRPCIAIV